MIIACNRITKSIHFSTTQNVKNKEGTHSYNFIENTFLEKHEAQNLCMKFKKGF